MRRFLPMKRRMHSAARAALLPAADVLAVVLAVVLAAAACASTAPSERAVGLFDEEVSGANGAGEASPVARAMPEMAPSSNFEAGEPPMMARASMSMAPSPAPPGQPVAAQGAPAEKSVATDAVPAADAPRGPRLVIYRGNLTVLVPSVDEASARLASRVEALGGYVESQSGSSGSNNAVVSLRVPAAHFKMLVDELGAFGQVTEKQLSASDVTRQVFDIELRLETAERSRQRLLDLLKTATKMEEILQIEGEVRRLTDEIEGMKGELRFLKDQVSMSTLTVRFFANAPPPTPGPSRRPSQFDWINKVGIEHVRSSF